MGVSKRVALSSHMGQRYYKLCQMTRDQWHLTILTYVKLNSMTWFGVIVICKYTFQIQKVSHMTVNIGYYTVARRYGFYVRANRVMFCLLYGLIQSDTNPGTTTLLMQTCSLKHDN